jgi:enoyl-CoA hydratase/carnithine racemase
MIVAASTASFSLPEVGLEPGRRVRRAVSRPTRPTAQHCARAALTGAPLGAERAHALGLVNHLTEPGQALPEALALARQIAEQAPLAVRETLAALERLNADDDDCGWELTRRAKAVARQSADSKEGVAAFKERRAPRWQGR